MAISNVSSNLRAGVCTFATRPQAPFTGQVIFEVDTKQTLVWQGSAWVMLTDADQPPGLQLVATQDFNAADPLELLNIFSADYVNYEVYLTYYGSASTVLGLRMFSGTNTEYALSNYYRYGFSYSGAGAFTNQIVSAANSITMATHITSSAQQTSVKMTFFHPNSNSQRKYIYIEWFEAQTGTFVNYQCQVVDNLAFTGLRLDAASGSITGKIRVYGLRD